VVKELVGRTFTRLTGHYITRKPPVPVNLRALISAADGPVEREALVAAREAKGDRLLVAPTFILSSVRSGSTLMRVMLNSHSQILAPHEIHLRDIRVSVPYKYAVQAVWELGLDRRDLQHLLWDRLLHRELLLSGKHLLVNKTPTDALIWRDIVECWPDARFIFLLRHPLAVTDSWNKARKGWSRERTAEDILTYLTGVDTAREEHGGLTVRYEDVTAEPERELRRICEFLGVAWEEQMLNYGEAGNSTFVTGLGDWSGKIRSGKVQPARPLPADEEIPEVLREISAKWGYLRNSSAVAS
jgi:sulfotransferase family protein